MFGYAEKHTYPTPKGSVREPGSLTLPRVTSTEVVVWYERTKMQPGFAEKPDCIAIAHE
jgi:hypothetical protein